MDKCKAMSKMWGAAKECVVELNGDVNKKRSMTFFGLLDACKKKLPELAVQADLEGFNLGEALFYALVREWNLVYKIDVFYIEGFSDVAYNLVCHLFEEEDFTQLFSSIASLLNAVLSLHSNERDVCQFSDEQAKDFYRLYNAIARRTSIALKQ